ncbi:unnamed protein product [Calypogeia fissa]
MEAISSFQRRLDEMHSATPRSLKRKILTNYSTPSQSDRNGNETQLLGTFEKRMKSARWESGGSTRANLFPTSVQPLQNVEQLHNYNLGSFHPFTIPQFSPRPVPSAGRPEIKAVNFPAPRPPPVLGKPGRVHNESLHVTRDSDTLSSDWFRCKLDRADKDRENEVLRKNLKVERAYRLKTMEDLERAKAAAMKQEMEFENFKLMVALKDEKLGKLLHGYRNLNARTEAMRLLAREDMRARGNSSFSFSRGMSRSGSQSDEGNDPRGRRGDDRNRAFRREAMKASERSTAEKMAQEMELDDFKRRVALNEQRIEKQGFQNVTSRTDSISFMPREDLRAIGNSSTSLSRRMSRSGSLSDDESDLRGDDSEHEPKWKELLNKIYERSKIEKKVSLEKEIEYTQSKLQALQLERPPGFKVEKKPEDKTLVDAFTPLSAEAEEAVDEALDGGNRYEVLVTHEKSNIDVTRGVMQCLSPGVWLNDEVINVYMELLKEREVREPDRFLKCHFFNTFFYNKLYKDKRNYDYKAIRRWTTQKKLGYSLSDCDKILVPIHQDIHWCLAVINIRDKRLEYLDSLKGGDRSVLDVLARYITDETKDKDCKVLDASTWEQGFPKNIPEQRNGCDCGMFMVKYADFHSRGAPLQFTQDDMEYFRRKMVWEILDLKAT